MEFPENYPFAAPAVRFERPPWHPNICPQKGIICTDILTGDHWTPALVARVVPPLVVGLLADPDPFNSLNNEATHQFKTDRAAYLERARRSVL